MGIRFLDSIFVFLTVCCAVFSAYFVGHALSSEHAAWAWITAAVLILLAAALGTFTVRRIRSFPDQRGGAGAH